MSYFVFRYGLPRLKGQLLAGDSERAHQHGAMSAMTFVHPCSTLWLVGAPWCIPAIKEILLTIYELLEEPGLLSCSCLDAS